MKSIDDVFKEVGLPAPYPYQRNLAEGAWPDVVHIPTGLGKTAAVTLAWIYRRQVHCDPEMPRRLVWCLPMRVLVEQTRENVRGWLRSLGLLGEPGEEGKIAVHTLMGGDPDMRRADWTSHPEQQAVLIGTQDMLLSRALMRGYGMSRYQWPVHYALLHNDALWVFDEVQLMGPALPTTTQLEAFRRSMGSAAPTRSTWISATLREDWLDSIDFRPYREAGLTRIELGDADRAEASVAQRIHATKPLGVAQTRLENSSKVGLQRYAAGLATEIAEAHAPGSQTLVIVNRVDRAQALYDALEDVNADRLLLHARFRAAERAAIERKLYDAPGPDGRIVVATQAVEAGVDLDSEVLFTELAPWSSLVQRFGRCNRGGQYDDAQVFWIDLDDEDDELVLPYECGALASARKLLQTTGSAAPAELPPVTDSPGGSQVIRRRDLLELFNTDPDLSGFDVDVSPYIRDTGTPQLQVFWRDINGDHASRQPAPQREELCPASLMQIRTHLKKRLPKAASRDHPIAWFFDPLAGDNREGTWAIVRNPEAIRPGQTLMLDAADGGYDPDRGFMVGANNPVSVIATEAAAVTEGDGNDLLTAADRKVSLGEHLADVTAAVGEVSESLGLLEAERTILETAARWHDVGKAHEAFQRGIGFDPDDPEGPWAKSGQSERPDYHCLDTNGQRQPRPGFRHELASTLAWLSAGGDGLKPEERDLVAFLIAAHHGRVRLGLRALPNEPEPPDAAETGRLYARGIWDGDLLPPLEAEAIRLSATTLSLGIMRLGLGPQGPSWSERTRHLLEHHGPFRLAWLEALLRIADWRASGKEGKA